MDAAAAAAATQSAATCTHANYEPACVVPQTWLLHYCLAISSRLVSVYADGIMWL